MPTPSTSWLPTRPGITPTDLPAVLGASSSGPPAVLLAHPGPTDADAPRRRARGSVGTRRRDGETVRRPGGATTPAGSRLAPVTGPETDLAARLQPWTSPEPLAERLGLRPDDAADAAVLVQEVLSDPLAAARVEVLVRRLDELVGRFGPGTSEGFDGPAHDHDSARLGHVVQGGVALVALLAATPKVVGFHAAHGIDAEQSWRTLSDLGQQVWVHRRTHGAFGLHTQGWLTCIWSGALHWLGRLQLNLTPLTDEEGTTLPGRWQLSVHIPESGPLTPEAVQDSFERAEAFFARHHPDHPVERLHCSSWLLDPALAEELPGSNLAAFQQRWTLTGRGRPGDADALFFTFRVRGEVDLATLPTDTRLQRLVVSRAAEGPGWVTTEGTAPLPSQQEAR